MNVESLVLFEVSEEKGKGSGEKSICITLERNLISFVPCRGQVYTETFSSSLTKSGPFLLFVSNPYL